ncbi:unnamed protein product [Brachionus calyciflorus]|uniref:NSFL1 cofactor p47 n=1 Tax=Brachionus calyciflorus TaxID=104777 RepID=A0A813MCT7_9BILA|nr:unnamed protein product [Brachionus calyciflorus]
MSSNITDEQIDNFCAVTGTTRDRARFYLEASNGDIEGAIGSFYEGGGDETDEPIITHSDIPQNYDMLDDDEDDDDDYEPPSRSLPQKKESPKSKPQRGSRARIFTLNDNKSDEEQDDEKGQAFYAGGSQASGQQILGPSTSKKNPEEIIKNLFQKAKEHGAQVVDSGEKSSNKGPVVYGTGYRLGTGNEPQEVIKGPEPPKPPKSSVLKLWKNGFNIDEGELRSYEDPKNKEFLSSIQRGELPQELIRLANGGEVHLDMQDHREEEFVPPKKQYVLYNTEGHKLGSPTPTVSTTLSASETENAENAAKRELNLDESKPTTQIQVRLSNGSRMVIKANQTHHISDLRKYINRARPEYSSRNYSLMTSFPNKEITNEAQSLAEANVLNAVIIQKLKE